MGHQSSAYIDDLVSKTYKGTLTNVSNTSILFEKLRFMINYKKSRMTPNTKMEHFGLIIDSEKITLSLTPEKVQKITTFFETCVNPISTGGGGFRQDGEFIVITFVWQNI